MKPLLVTPMLLLFAMLAGCGRPTPPSISLQDAARTGNLEAIQQHIKAASNLNEKEPVGGSSPLNTAATFGQTDAARALIKGGADVNSRNNDGATPLMTATFLRCLSQRGTADAAWERRATVLVDLLRRLAELQSRRCGVAV